MNSRTTNYVASMKHVYQAAIIALLSACEPAVVVRPQPRPPIKGSSLMLDLGPVERPKMLGAYDFELLGQGTGRACADADAATVYWVGMPDLAQLSPYPIVRAAIAAAALDAISRLNEDVDSIVLTSVVASSVRGGAEVCASVKGRGVRLKKAGVTDVPAEEPREPLREPKGPATDGS